MKSNAKNITLIALFIALSVALSYVKIMGSIALDQIPAFLLFIIYRDKKCCFVSSFAHLTSAFIAGFPFTILVHLLIAIGMFLMFYIAIPIINHTNKYIAFLFIAITNSFVLTFLAFITIPFNITTYVTISSMLFLASVINIVCTLLLEKPVRKALQM